MSDLDPDQRATLLLADLAATAGQRQPCFDRIATELRTDEHAAAVMALALFDLFAYRAVPDVGNPAIFRA